MIGVVVWSNSSREQAVIWCDDHAALAFLSGRECFTPGAGWPEPGEMLELETETIGAIRHARNVRPIDSTPCSRLPDLLSLERATHLSLVHDSEADDPDFKLQRCVGA